jgi:hypothetical protein
MHAALSVESIVGPDGLGVTYTRAPATGSSPWIRQPGVDEAFGAVTCVLPGGHTAEGFLVEQDSSCDLFVSLQHEGMLHEVLIHAPSPVPNPAVWASLDLIAPVGGWRVTPDDFAAARSLLSGDPAAVGRVTPLIESLCSDVRFVAAVKSTHRRSVVLDWDAQGISTRWLIGGELSETNPSATVGARADHRYIDIWTATTGALAATIAQRLDRCGGVVSFDGQTYESADEVAALISMLGESLAA